MQFKTGAISGPIKMDLGPTKKNITEAQNSARVFEHVQMASTRTCVTVQLNLMVINVRTK